MKNKTEYYQICSRGIWDTSVPGITFDENGVSNYAKMYDVLCDIYPRGERGKNYWQNIVDEIIRNYGQKKYNCIVGVSGGTDSSYLLYLLKEVYGLKPLAVNLDNGWNSDISQKNIKKMVTALNIDLETYVIDYEEIKDLMRCYMKASLPWIDFPTDYAIKSVMYKLADKEGIKYIFRGNDFRSEGTQPREWTYSDRRQLKYISKKYGNIKIKTFPELTPSNYVYYRLIKNIKEVYPYYYLEYSKQDAMNFLIKNFKWEYYGGHHHENIFTKFAISYWLPVKFGIDKRIITLSAQILSGKISREDALNELKNSQYGEEQIQKDIEYVIKKLDFTKAEFEDVMKSSNKYYYDFPSYDNLFNKYGKIIHPVINKMLGYKAMNLIQLELRNKI